MGLSMSTAIAQIRDLVAEVTGLTAVYAPSETDGNRLPVALNDLPCAIVLPGPTRQYILSAGQHRHTYAVIINIYEALGADIGDASNVILPMGDGMIEKFAVNVGLADADGSDPRANSCLFESSSGFQELEYSGIPYIGYVITLRVSEQASAAPVLGS